MNCERNKLRSEISREDSEINATLKIEIYHSNHKQYHIILIEEAQRVLYSIPDDWYLVVFMRYNKIENRENSSYRVIKLSNVATMTFKVKILNDIRKQMNIRLYTDQTDVISIDVKARKISLCA